jgi:hypothetical protein
MLAIVLSGFALFSAGIFLVTYDWSSVRLNRKRGTEAPRPLLSGRLGPPQLQERSSCSIAFSRFLRARSIALTSLGAILPAEISVSILVAA